MSAPAVPPHAYADNGRADQSPVTDSSAKASEHLPRTQPHSLNTHDGPLSHAKSDSKLSPSTQPPWMDPTHPQHRTTQTVDPRSNHLEPHHAPPLHAASLETNMSAADKQLPANPAASATPEPPPPPRKPRPVRKRRLPGGGEIPKSILKPAPPPQKAFSFRRDILQSLNSRLAQQGVNVQVPVPQGGTAQGAANLLGGVFKRIGGMAGAALAGPSSDSPTPAAPAATPGGQTNTSAATASLQNVVAKLQAVGQSAPAPAAFRGQTASRQTGDNDVSNRSVSGGSGDPPSAPVSQSTLSSTSGLPAPSSSPSPLKRVQFTVSKMSVVYPISGAIAPGDEDETRRRIESQHRQSLKERKEKNWTPQELELLYRECCRVREEHPLKKMRLIFEEAAQNNPPALKTLDLSFLPLDRQAIDPVADLLSVDFGLTKLVLENCGLTDDGLKAILHALLVSGTLPNLSIASNRKIRYQGWRYVAIFMRRAKALRYLDLSENSINRASLEHIAEAIRKPASSVTKSAPEQAKRVSEGEDSLHAGANAHTKETRLATASNPEDMLDEDGEPLMPPASLLRRELNEESTSFSSAVISLRLENCGLRGASLAQLAQAVRFSDLKHLSLRRNKINQVGAVALAAMIKDYPDVHDDVLDDERTAVAPDRGSTGGSAASSSSQGAALGRPDGSVANSRRFSPSLPDVPVITSSPGGGITARRLVPDSAREGDAAEGHEHLQAGRNGTGSLKPATQSEVEAMAISNAKRAKRILNSIPRVGNLLTLDLKSNHIRGGVFYLAQVLRKNRTLRVLNLSDNNIETQGLVMIADALKYNSTLETLDLSHNPCSGPGIEGITTLRTAFTLNSNLKRLFLNDTDLSSEGAIALAEFLPEARSLIHLDLTENFDIDIAGVMALAVSVRLNKSLRCLDLNIPPNDPDFARLSQEILQACIRNTQLAQKKAQQRGLKQPIAAPIYKSVVARAAKEKDERQKAIDATKAIEAQASAAAEEQRSATSHQELLDSAESCHAVLQDLLQGEERRRAEASAEQPLEPPPDDFVRDLVGQSHKLRSKLAKAVGAMQEGEMLKKALRINDDLETISGKLVAFYQAFPARSPGRSATQTGGSKNAATGPPDPASALPPPVIDSSLSSPSFSIGSEDEDEDDEDDDAGASGSGGSGNPRTDTNRMDDARPSLVVAVAEKEALDDLNDDPPSPKSPREVKAKSMVDEEGEIFRRAKSLQLQEEAQDDLASDEAEASGLPYEDSALRKALVEHDVLGTADVGTATNSNATAADSSAPSQALSSDAPPVVPPRPGHLATPTQTAPSTLQSRARRSSSASTSSPSNGPKELPVSAQASQDEDLPGDELRKRLLEADFDSPPIAAANDGASGSAGVGE